MCEKYLFTTGYAGFDQDSFLWKLNLDQIKVVIDVREKPFSRNRSFSQPALRSFLQIGGIDYIHFGELGVPSKLRSILRSGGNINEYFKAYLIFLNEQETTIEKLMDIIVQRRCCLLCLEKDPLECHRSVLANLLVKRHSELIEVKHI